MNVELERDLYGVLGVEPSADSRQLRRAFRTLAVHLHPDLAGPASSLRFQAVVDAYRVLGDAGERRRYDVGREVSGPVVQLPRAAAAAPEVLGELSLLEDFRAPGTERERLRERLGRNFTGRHVPKAERLEPLELDLVLSPEEAARGGLLRLGVPTLTRCPVCAGTGREWLYPCFGCSGQGMVEAAEQVPVHIPPGVASGTHFLVELHHLGIDNVYLDLAVHVRDAH